MNRELDSRSMVDVSADSEMTGRQRAIVSVITPAYAARRLDISPVNVLRTLCKYNIPVELSTSHVTVLPQIVVPLLRQMRAKSFDRIPVWQDVMRIITSADAWKEITEEWQSQKIALLDQVSEDKIQLPNLAGNRSLLAIARITASAMNASELSEDVETQSMIVDNLEDPDRTVVLLGEEQRATQLKSKYLKYAGLCGEKLIGYLQKTVIRRNKAGSATHKAFDAWPALGVDYTKPFVPDPELWAMKVDVSLPDWYR